MQNVTFILDDDCFSSHVGVRRYVLSMAKLLSQEFNVRLFNVEYELINNQPLFSEVFIDDLFALDNGFSINNLVGQDRSVILKNLSRTYFEAKLNSNKSSGIYKLAYGKRLPPDLDLIVVAAPWVLRSDLPLVAKSGVFGIAYDAIPNHYSLANPSNAGLMELAYQHIYAYSVFLSKYSGLLAISNESAMQIAQLLPKFKNKIYAVPTFLPFGFEGVAKEKSEDTVVDRALLLASPFDVRKGLKILPKYINMLNIDQLIIFGSPRCSYEDIHEFFNGLSIEKITWWSKVNFLKQVELYKQAKVVLFPSLNEGLGLPVLESYCCDVPIFVSNIKPLNQLVNVSYVLSDKFENSISNLQAEIDSKSEVGKYKGLALNRWSSSHLIKFIYGLTVNYKVRVESEGGCA